MAAVDKHNSSVSLSRLFLQLTNPRHEALETEDEVIAYLCANEDVLPLAKDIAENGLNPIEKLAVIPLEKGPVTAKSNFTVAEGNRRVCALKLLNDPARAPSKWRRSFEKLSAEWKPIRSLSVSIFRDDVAVKPWLDRIHSGLQGGIGRKPWNAEQKTRFDGGSKNAAAQKLLDYALAEGLIKAEDRANKLTTVQRFLSNQVFREALGFDQSNIERPARIRPQPDFNRLLAQFMRDLVDGKKVNSRMNRPEIVSYARELRELPNLSNQFVEAEPLTRRPVALKSKGNVPIKASKPEKIKTIQQDATVFNALELMKNEKLKSLYYSICSIEFEHHAPLIGIGIWAFFETLTNAAGKGDGASFESFISKERLGTFGITDRNDLKAIKEALERIAQAGNTTKHHKVAATFNGLQLNNDLSTLSEVILKCIETVTKQQK